MKWLKTNICLVVALMCHPIISFGGDFVNFENCSIRYYEKRIMQWAQAYPESLSHLPSGSKQWKNLYLFKIALQDLKRDIEDFPDIYKAALSIARKRCFKDKNRIGASLRSKFVVANKLYDELSYIYDLLKYSKKYQQSISEFKRSVQSANELRKKLEIK